MFRPISRLAALTSLALAATAFAASPSIHAAPAMKVYQSSAFHYSFSYPASWVVTHSKDLDAVVAAPDNNAALVAAVIPGSMSSSALKAFLKKELTKEYKIKGTPKYTVGTSNGVSYEDWSGEAMVGGQAAMASLFGTTHGKFTYFFVASAGMGLSTSKADAAQLDSIVNSLKLL